MHVAYGRGSVLSRQGNEIPRERGNLGGFLPTDNALYCIEFGTRTKTDDPVKIPIGTVTRVGCRYHVLDGGPDLLRGRGNFGGCPGHSKAFVIFAASVAA